MSGEPVSEAEHRRLEDKAQAEIMAHVRVRAISKARLIEELSYSRGKISA